MPDVFLITGAASGIGRHLVEHYASPAGGSHRILAADIDVEGLQRLKAATGFSDEQVAVATLDVRSPDNWRAVIDDALDRFGDLDVLMNVAGVLMPGYVWEFDAKQVDFHVDVNIKGVMHGTNAAAQTFRSRGAGHIINIGSLSGLVPVSGLTLYSATKFAVRGFSLAAAQDLAPHGVSLTVINPDAVATPMLDLQVDYEQAALTFSGEAPLTVQEVREAVDKALETKAMELLVPFGRGLIARLTTFAPAPLTKVAPLFKKRGIANQQKAKQGR